MRRYQRAALAAICVPLLSSLAVPAHADTRIGRQVSPFIAQSADLGPVARSSPVQITVWLKLRDAAGLENLVTDPTATGKTLSAEQIRAQYAPAANTVAAV